MKESTLKLEINAVVTAVCLLIKKVVTSVSWNMKKFADHFRNLNGTFLLHPSSNKQKNKVNLRIRLSEETVLVV